MITCRNDKIWSENICILEYKKHNHTHKTTYRNISQWGSIFSIRERKLATFIPWGPASIQVVLSKKSPYVQSSHRVNGLMIANHSSIAALMQQCVNDFDRLKKKKAFIQNYASLPGGEEEFDDCREIVTSLIDEYKATEQPDYVNMYNNKM